MLRLAVVIFVEFGCLARVPALAQIGTDGKLPPSCNACVQWARGPIRNQLHPMILRSPTQELLRLAERREPWVMEIVVKNDGIPCFIGAVRDDGPIMHELIRTLMDWRFKPFETRQTHEVCFIAKVYCYIRKSGTRLQLVVPDITTD